MSGAVGNRADLPVRVKVWGWDSWGRPILAGKPKCAAILYTRESLTAHHRGNCEEYRDHGWPVAVRSADAGVLMASCNRRSSFTLMTVCVNAWSAAFTTDATTGLSILASR